jgi:hypothetical protein
MSNTKQEFVSLRLADEMIFSLRARSHAYHVGFYMIPYIQAHIFGIGSSNARKQHCLMPERISLYTLYMMGVGWEVSLIPICTNSYLAISFLIQFLPAG